MLNLIKYSLSPHKLFCYLFLPATVTAQLQRIQDVGNHPHRIQISVPYLSSQHYQTS